MYKLIIFILIFNVAIGYSQNVREVIKPERSDYLDSVFSELSSKRDSGLYTAINILENGLKHTNSAFEIHKITFNLGALYTLTKQFDKSIDLWLWANSQGICYNFQFNKNPYPKYLEAYEDNERFFDFIVKNDSLRNEISINSKAEYFVNLPIGYDKSIKYPLVIILHGGVGNFYNTLENWYSEKIKTKLIAVYPQGREVKSTFDRSYGNNGIKDIMEIYNQLINNYSIDTTSVILAGQSAGGELALELANGWIPAKGLFLAFPVKPGDYNINKAQKLKKASVKVYMTCGEHDQHFYRGQLELSKLLDSAEVDNRFIKYPDLGHEFPSDFEKQLDNGLKFIFDNKESYF